MLMFQTATYHFPVCQCMQSIRGFH